VSLLLLFLFLGLLNNTPLFIFSEYYLSPYQKKEKQQMQKNNWCQRNSIRNY